MTLSTLQFIGGPLNSSKKTFDSDIYQIFPGREYYHSEPGHVSADGKPSHMTHVYRIVEVPPWLDKATKFFVYSGILEG